MTARKHTDTPLARLAKQFLHHAERYFDLQERRTIAARILGFSKTPDVRWKLDRAIRSYQKAESNRRRAMLALRDPLTAKLEQSHMDSTPLLVFLGKLGRNKVFDSDWRRAEVLLRHAVARGKLAVEPVTKKPSPKRRQQKHSDLTPKEKDAWIAHERLCSIRATAHELGVSPAAIQKRLANARRKISARSRTRSVRACNRLPKNR